jgi:hypothetical protein
MVESGEQGPGAKEDPGTRFARLSAEIAKARRQLAALRHEGERHFIDDQPVHPDVPGVLEQIVSTGDELAALQAMSSGSSDVNPALNKGALDDQHQRLDQLEARIQTLSQLYGDDPHKHERHFIDG